MAQPEFTYKGLVATFRSPGTAAAGQVWLACWNGSSGATAKDMAIREVLVHQDFAGASGSRRDQYLSFVSAAATGGTVLTKVPIDTALSSDANVVFLGGASADGTNTTITASITSAFWKAWGQVDPSAVGQMLMDQHVIYPLHLVEWPLILVPGTGFCVYTPMAGSTSSHYIVTVRWEEFTRLRGGTIKTVRQAVNRAATF